MQIDMNTKLLLINPEFASIVIQSQSFHVLYLDSETNCLVTAETLNPPGTSSDESGVVLNLMKD
jgi:hypothetical protein